MGRIIQFSNLPFELLMPPSNNAKDIAIKTVPSGSKMEIKQVLQQVYRFEVEKVRTLNMQGKKYRRKFWVTEPNYKKAYVTLKNPLSIFLVLYNRVNPIENETKSIKK